MCDDSGRFCEQMALHGIATTPVQNAGWGMLTELTLPGGGKLGVYQPRHARPEPMAAQPRARIAPRAAKSAARPARKAAKAAAARPTKKPAARKAKKKR